MPGNQTYHTGSINVERILQSHRRETGGTNDKHSNENQRLPLTTERIEESGSCLNTDSKNKKYQTEISNSFGNDDAKVPEKKCDKDYRRHQEITP